MGGVCGGVCEDVLTRMMCVEGKLWGRIWEVYPTRTASRNHFSHWTPRKSLFFQEHKPPSRTVGNKVR